MRALLLLGLFLSSCATKQKNVAPPSSSEAPPAFMTHIRQLTFDGHRAGEGYLSRDGHQMIFQSEREPGNPFYQIYLMNLDDGRIQRVSPGRGKTTCSWIAPDGKKVLFASTHADPDVKRKIDEEWAERKAPKKKYNWSFDEAYEIYESRPDGTGLKNLTHARGYDAEGSYSPDGQWIAFASNRAGYAQKLSPADQAKFDRDPSYMMDIYIMRADGSEVKRLTDVKGYDGGPFFSPDGQRLTFRRFTENGRSAEVYTMNVDGSDQKQLTHLGAMSWAPFYHPSGDYLIFATNKEGYANFELYLVDAKGEHAPVRASYLPNFDGLPVFTPDGRGLIWTHSSDNGEAQLYRADWDDNLARQALGLAAKNLPSSLPENSPRVKSDDVMDWVNYLASDRFGGRPTGGLTEAEYSQKLANAFQQMGLKPGFRGSYFQKYEFTSGIELGAQNVFGLTVNHKPMTLSLGRDWTPLSYAKNGHFGPASMVFAGYGIRAPAADKQPEYDAYQDLDVKGKWVVAFAGLPDDVTNERRFHLHIYSRLQHKATVAKQQGALGLILVEDAVSPKVDMNLHYEGREDDAGLPVLRVSADVADQLFTAAGMNRAEWTKKLAKGGVGGQEMAMLSAEATIDLQLKKSVSNNILARLDAPGAKHSVIVGAHLDHLGLGEGGTSLSKVKGVIHYGADDNASGVAGVMRVANVLSERVKQGLKLKQNVIFALWTGEEIGVLGSSHYAKTQAREDKIAASINLDMIGRLRENLIVQGLGSAAEWRGLIERNNFESPMPLTLQDDPYLPSDALSFYMKQIPSIMLFTGSHPQYHTGEDKPALINAEGLARTADWAARLALRLASSAQPLVKYVKVESTKPKGESRGFRLYLGTIPDYTQEGKKGVLISGTSKDSPAERAGLRPGDLITSLGGMKIDNLNDYVYCLQALKANEKTKIRVVRAGAEKELEITPTLRTN